MIFFLGKINAKINKKKVCVCVCVCVGGGGGSKPFLALSSQGNSTRAHDASLQPGPNKLVDFLTRRFIHAAQHI